MSKFAGHLIWFTVYAIEILLPIAGGICLYQGGFVESPVAVPPEIQAKLDEQVTVTIGGLGFEFDPIITKIILELKSETLFMSAEVSDERPSTLSYRWTTSPSLSITNPFSSEATLDVFDNSSITVILRVTDDTETFTTEICAWDYSANPKTCSFLGN